MILIPGFTDADKVPGAVAINQWGAGKVSIGAIPLQCVLYGNKTSAGYAAVNSKTFVTTPADADAAWGTGSELSRMASAALEITGVTLYGVCVQEASGSAATALIELKGTWTAAGELTFQLDEEIFHVAFASSDNTLTGAATVVANATNARQSGRMFCTAAQTTLSASNTAVTETGTGPAVTITGTPAASYNGLIKMQLGGAVATATFEWSTDGGVTWTATSVTTASTVALGSTGLTANFAAGTYVIGTTYAWQSFGASAGYVTLTVNNIGVRGNQHTLFLVDSTKAPSGMSVILHGGTHLANGGCPFSGGVGTDDVTAALAALASVQNDYEAYAQNDTTNIGLVEASANAKAAYNVGLLQQYVTSTNGTLSNAIALGQTQMNDVLGFCGWVQYGVEHPSLMSARQAAIFSVTDGDQPNTNFDGMVVTGAAPHFQLSDSPNRSTKNSALNAGVTPYETVNGALQIVRAINSHCLTGSTPDYRTYDHSNTAVPIRVRKELLAIYQALAQTNPYSGPDIGDGLPPPGTLTPRVWNSNVEANLRTWSGPEFNWLTDVDDNLPDSEWNSSAERIMSVVPTIVKPQLHQLGVIVMQTAP